MTDILLATVVTEIPAFLGGVGHQEKHNDEKDSYEYARGQPSHFQHLSYRCLTWIDQEAQNGSNQVVDYDDRKGWDVETIDGFENNEDAGGREYAEQ